MNVNTLTLAYQRVKNTELSTGSFFLSCDGVIVPLEHFVDQPYLDVLKRLALHISKYASLSVFIQRTDREGLAPLQLAEEEVQLFRTDPAKAISSKVFPHVQVNLRSKRDNDRVVPLLTAGYDCIVDCFGDQVYLKVKKRNNGTCVECPVCGNLRELVANSVNCSCGTSYTITELKADIGWASIEVDQLLQMPATRFFLPRKWHEHGNWISKEELTKKLKQFREERANVLK